MPGRRARRRSCAGRRRTSADEARARAARRGGDPRRRLVALPAAAQPRQHDRGRHVGGPAQHRRRARARPPEERADGLRVHRGAAGAEGRRRARGSPSATRSTATGTAAGRPLVGARGARLARRLVRGRRRRARLRRGGAAARGARLRALPGPVPRDVGWRCRRSARGPRAVAAGEAWSFALDGLVPASARSTASSTGRHRARRRRGARDVDPTVRRPLEPATARRSPARANPARPRRDGRRGGRHRAARARARHRAREDARAVRQADRRLPGRLAPARADTYTDVELARSLAYWAAWCVAEDDEQAPLAAAAAKAFAAEAAVAACERSIQVHGGTGFTWEHPLHRFYKRALWLEGYGSRPAELRARGRGRAARRTVHVGPRSAEWTA